MRKKQLSAFNYFGGKNAKSLLTFILENLSYSNKFHLVDVFGGSAAVCLNYTKAKARTLNDLNEDIYNFFQVLRNNPEKLISQLELTPHSRKDYQTLQLELITDQVERARAFFIRTVCSFGNTGSLKKYNSWSYTVNDYRYSVSQSVARLLSKVEGLHPVAEELRLIQLECRDFRQIIKTYDGPNTIFYVDPPYVKSTRTGNINYKHELLADDHIELCELLNSIKGHYCLSGYDNPIYQQHLKYIDSRELTGCKTNASKRTTEKVWANYPLRKEEEA